MKIVKDNLKIVCDINGCNNLAVYKVILDIGEHDSLVTFGDEIVFNVSFDKEWVEGQTEQSRTQSDERIAALKIGGDSLFISVAVEPNHSLPLGCTTFIEQSDATDSLAVATRGEALATATLTEYFVTAALSDSKLYFEDLPMTPTSSSGKFWPAERMTFMSYAPAAARPASLTMVEGKWQGAFTYTMPAPTGVSSQSEPNIPTSEQKMESAAEVIITPR